MSRLSNREVQGTEVKALLAFVLVAVTVALLFVPITNGAGEIRSMFVLLTGIVVYDFIRSVQEDKRVRDIRDAYDPKPSPSTVFDHEETQVLR